MQNTSRQMCRTVCWASVTKCLGGGIVGQTEELYLEDELARAADNKKPQLRGFDNDEASKFRITVELRQVILNYFGDEDPVGIVGKPGWWLQGSIAGFPTLMVEAGGRRLSGSGWMAS